MIKEDGVHDIECKIKNQNSHLDLQELRNNPSNNNPDSYGIDFTSFMKKRTDKLALENLHLKPKEIWDKLSEELNAIQPT